MKELAIGGVLGFVLYGFVLSGVPAVMPALPTQVLENLALNEVGAFLLGFLGGYVGRRYLDAMVVSGKPRAAEVEAAA